MKSPYLVRTAAVASLATALLAAGYMGMPGEEMPLAPQAVASSASSAEPAYYFPAGFEMKVDAEDGTVREYY